MKSFEERSGHERDLDRDKQSFIEAISTISIAEIPTEFAEQSVQKLTTNLEKTGLFILGEVHGVKENCDIIYTLFKRFGFRQLALEWESELKDTVEKFLRSGELDFDAIDTSSDGRITAGHFALIKKLKAEGILKRIVCFDQIGSSSWNERDANMSKNLLANLSEEPTLAVAGDRHTKKEPTTFDDDPGEKHPMGENVKKEIPDVSSGEIEYLSGQFHNSGIQEFFKNPERENLSGAKFYQDENDVYIFELPQAHLATVPNPNEKM